MSFKPLDPDFENKIKESFSSSYPDHMQAGGFCRQERGADPVRDSIDDIDDAAWKAG